MRVFKQVQEFVSSKYHEAVTSPNIHISPTVAEKIDLHAIVTCCNYNKRYKHYRKKNPQWNGDITAETQEEWADLKAASKLSRYKLNGRAKQLVADQVEDLLKYVNEDGGFNPYPKPIFHPQKLEKHVSEKYENLIERSEDHDIAIYNPGKEIKHPDGFTLSVTKSEIDHPSSGYGVYVKGEALPGTVIVLYPGFVHYAQSLGSVYVDSVGAKNEYLIRRYDDIFVDGNKWDKVAENAVSKVQNKLYHIATSGGGKSMIDELAKFRNQFAIGQYVNHPARGQTANVLPFGFDYPGWLAPELQQYIPHQYFEDDANSKYYGHQTFTAAGRGVVLITTETVKNSELLLNYRYPPGQDAPDWYHQPDELIAKMRHARKGFFSRLLNVG